jgi:hypothetical protein
LIHQYYDPRPLEYPILYHIYYESSINRMSVAIKLNKVDSFFGVIRLWLRTKTTNSGWRRLFQSPTP